MAEKGREQVAVLREEGKRLDFFRVSFGEKEAEFFLEERMEEQYAGAAEKAELKPDMSRDKRIADQFDS